MIRGPFRANFAWSTSSYCFVPIPFSSAALDQLNAAQKDPQPPFYHHWLTPETFGLHFGVSDHDLAAIVSWLRSEGLDVDPVPPGRRSIVFSGTAAAVEAAFHTQIHEHLIDGEMHYANATDPEIPEALAEVVAGPVPLHDFPPRSLIDPAPRYSSPYAPLYGIAIAPSDFAAIYNLRPLYDDNLDGSGETIAILGVSNVNVEDVQTFMDTFTGCVKCTPVQRQEQPFNFQVVLAGADPGNNSAQAEATLDVERAMSVAPGALVKLVVGPTVTGNCLSTTILGFIPVPGPCTSISVGGVSAPPSNDQIGSLMYAGLFAVENNIAPIISVSFGECEAQVGNNISNGNNWWFSLWQEAESLGIAVFVASGDGGAAGCDVHTSPSGSGRAVNGICSPPQVACVGGTEFEDWENWSTYWPSGAAAAYIPEAVWNESGSGPESCQGVPPATATNSNEETVSTNVYGGLWASGGGESAIWSKPSYQSLLTPADGQRDVPDVSLSASGHYDPYVIYLNGGLQYYGGTSAAAPSMAGIWALMLQDVGGTRLGNAGSLFYVEAYDYGRNPNTNPFHPTPCGNNSVPGVTGYSATGATYNQATGLGSVNAANMALGLNNGTYKPTLTLTATPATVNMAVGATAQVTLQVAATGGFNSAVTVCASSVPSGFSIVTPPATSLPAPGGGNITFTFTTNLAASAGYTGYFSISVCGQGQEVGASVTVNVVSCGFAVTPATIPEPAVGGTIQMSIQAPLGCNWTATASPWVTILSPTSGSGDASLIVSYAANPSAGSRLGGVTVQGLITAILSEIVGTTINQAGSVAHVPGDFSGDGVTDLLWHNETTGQVTVNYCPGEGLPFCGPGWNWLNNVGQPTGWVLVGAADFDGNGTPDLVWEYMPTGQVTVNYYSYNAQSGPAYEGWNWLNKTGNPGWTVVAVADMNGDGMPDLIWQNNTTNQVSVNYYSGSGGAVYEGWNWLNSAGQPPGWRVVAAADFDENGTPDLVWEYMPTGQVTVNYFSYSPTSGPAYTGWNWLNETGNPGWNVVGANYYYTNGVPALVWENESTRQVTVHYYGGAKGATFLGWNWLNSTGNPGWMALVPQ